MPYTCDYHGENVQAAGSVVVTNLAAGQTVSACAEHAPVMMVGWLAAALGVDVEPLYEAIRRHVNKTVKAAAAGAGAAAPVAAEVRQITCPGCETTLEATPDTFERVTAAHEAECAPLRALMEEAQQ